MKRILVLIIPLCLAKPLFAQYVYTINADSVKITNHCDTAELIIENHTQNVSGFLFNKGRGRTEFRKTLQKINDSLYLVGTDSLKLPPGLRLPATQIAFGSSANTVTGASSLTYDSVNRILTLGPAHLTTANNNIMFSYNLPVAPTGAGNVAVGMHGLFAPLTTGAQNIAIGDYTMTGVTSGSGNTAVGPGALQRLTTGTRNVGLGYQALQWLTTQAYNTAVGPGVFNNAIVGTGNVNIGGNPFTYFSIPDTIGDNNVFIGYKANDLNSTGNTNIVIGDSSYTDHTNNSTLIGTGMNTSLSNVVGIGRDDQNVIVGTTAVASDNGAKLQINTNAAALNINANWDESVGSSLLSANVNTPLNGDAFGPLFNFSVNSRNLLMLGADGMLTFSDPWNGGEFNNRYLTIAPADRIGGSYGSFNNSVMKIHSFFDPESGDGSMAEIAIASEVEPSGGSTSYSAIDIYPEISQSGGTGSIRGIYYHPSLESTLAKHIAFENTYGDIYLNSGGDFSKSSRVGVHNITSPSAWLHIGPGYGFAGSAPLKLTASPGYLLATPEDGAVEYDGTDLYFTQDNTRYKLSKTLTGQLTTSFGGASLTAGNTVTATISVPGAQPGDVVAASANSGAVNPPSIIITAFITTAGSVTLQAYNSSGSTVTLASDTYKVRVIR